MKPIFLFCFVALVSFPSVAMDWEYSLEDALFVFTDRDRDGIHDARDNCPYTFNPKQDDSDNDGIGDVCDDDDCGCSYENQWIYVCQDGHTRRVTCSALTDNNTYCGPCEEQEKSCASCEPTDDGKIIFCHIPLNPNNLRTIVAKCEQLDKYFNNDGSFAYPDDQCGPCQCEMIGDKDSDGDGVCDKKDECPDNPEKSEAGMCGCDDDDSDKDWVCDSEDICPGWNDKRDDDGDGIPNGCDPCPDDHSNDSDGDGVCDNEDICPGSDDFKDTDGDGVPNGCDLCPLDAADDSDGDGVCDTNDRCPGSDDLQDINQNGIPDGCEQDCCPASGNSAFEWIDNTKLNDVFTNSGDDGGYGDYRHVRIKASKGGILSLWVTPGYTDNICEVSIAAYVDWNNDKDFDDEGEHVFAGRTLEETGTDVVIPDNAYMGELCLRIIVDYGRIQSACDPCIDGEVEDYTLVIEDNLCQKANESFVYDTDQDIQGKNGGSGWTSPWSADKDGVAKARILQNSLYYFPLQSEGNKLAVMNQPGSLLSLKRSLNFEAGQSFWMSFLYMRAGGKGTFFLELGDLVIDINSAGNFWIGDQSGPRAEDGQVYFVLVKVDFKNGADDIYLWINPSTDGAPSEASAIVVQQDVANTFNELALTFKSIDGQDGVYQYIDEIRLGCDRSDVAVLQSPGSGLNTPAAASFIVAPNPVLPGTTVGIILNNATYFEGQMSIYTNDGQLVKTAKVLAGTNTMDTEGMLPGIYLVEIKTVDSIMRERLLIQD